MQGRQRGIDDALSQVLAFVSEHIQPGEARLAGNSVHVDAAFLRRLMPRLHAHLHHRIVDVSTVAELCTRWYPQDAKKMPRKKVGAFCLSRGFSLSQVIMMA